MNRDKWKNLVNEVRYCWGHFFLPKYQNYTKAIIIARPRTGSTWLCRILNSHPAALFYSEIFHPRKAYWGRLFHPYLPCHFDRNQEAEVFLNKYVFSPQPQNIKVLGFKIIRSQLEEISSLREYLRINKQVKIINLTRNNYLAQYLSIEKIRLREQKNTIYSNKTTIDFNKMLSHYNKLISYDAVIEKLIEGHQVFSLTYEKLINDHHDTVTNMLSFLDLPATKTNHRGPRRNLTFCAEEIENYQELKLRAKGSAIEKFFV